MIKYLIEKRIQAAVSQLILAKADFHIPMYDYDIDALGCQLGDKEYQSEYCG